MFVFNIKGESENGGKGNKGEKSESTSRSTIDYIWLPLGNKTTKKQKKIDGQFPVFYLAIRQRSKALK